MRDPRYKFPDHVRATTRTIASRMVQEGTVARTPEELEEWIAREPQVRESLEAGGYGTHFTAADLFPLLQALVAKQGGTPPEEDASPKSSSRWWVAIVVAVIIVILLLLFVAAAALPELEAGLVAVPALAAIETGDLALPGAEVR